MELEFPELPVKAALSEWQTYVARVVSLRGWDTASNLEVFLLLSEEVGEFAKALRYREKLFPESKEESLGSSSCPEDLADVKDKVAEELADIFSYLLDLANRLDVDLEQAFAAKEIYNRKRRWH